MSVISSDVISSDVRRCHRSTALHPVIIGKITRLAYSFYHVAVWDDMGIVEGNVDLSSLGLEWS